jgi:hypothetical protein
VDPCADAQVYTGYMLRELIAADDRGSEESIEEDCLAPVRLGAEEDLASSAPQKMNGFSRTVATHVASAGR